MDGVQASTSQEGNVRKGLDQLSREELIKKCKGLLVLAQKAKQAKDEMSDENRSLRDELSKHECQKEADKNDLITMKEMVDALTENKLSQTSKIADLQSKIGTYEKDLQTLRVQCSRVEELSIENESLRRQIERLSDENDSLLSNLDHMEKELEKVNEIGIQQRKDLILLDEATTKWRTLETNLRQQVANLHAENQRLEEDMSQLKEQTSDDSDTAEKLKEFEEMIQSLTNENENLRKDRDRFQADAERRIQEEHNCENCSRLQSKCENLEEERAKHADEVNMVRKSEEIQNAKLQNIKIKLIEVTLKLKKLKKSKHVLMDAVQEYYLAIPKWQSEVSRASSMLGSRLKNMENIRRVLERKVKLLEDELRSTKEGREFYENKLCELIDCCDRVVCENRDNSEEVATNERKDVHKKEEGTNTEHSSDENLKIIDALKDELERTTKDYEQSCKHLSTMQEDLNKQSIVLESTQSELVTLRKTYEDHLVHKEELEGKHKLSTEQVRMLEDQNVELKAVLERNQNKLDQLQNALTRCESEHADLLSEMRELNEALKGRGDVISRKQERIAELEKELKITKENLIQLQDNLTQKDGLIATKETQLDQMNKDVNEAKDEVANLSQQARESERMIKNLSDEIALIRDRSCDAQSEILSTSTISKVEETARMKDIDDTFEEKYNKLRSLAIKLKKKVQEQASQLAILENDNKRNSDEKNEIKSKLGTINFQVKDLQILQNANDKLLDEIESVKKEKINLEKQVKELTESIRAVIDSEKSSTLTEGDIQEYQKQIRVLKQEKETFNIQRREWDKDRDRLMNEIAAKDKELATLKQQQEKLKAELEKCKMAGTQRSVLNLEIEAYEKSLNEVTQNLKAKDILLKDLQDTLITKSGLIESNNKEIKLLEESIDAEREHSHELKQQIDFQHVKFKETEHEKSKLRERVEDLTTESENFKTRIDELLLQLSQLAGERDQLINNFQKEKESLYRQVVGLEENLNIVSGNLKTTEHELEDIKTEYANYKIRAQSVLRQNQTKETSRERELEEEVTGMRSTIETLNLEISKLKESLISSERKVDEFREDNERIQKRCKDLLQLLEECRIQNDSLLEDNRKQSLEYQESLKTHRLQIDAINSCYKQQVEDLEKKHANEIEELKKVGNSAQDKKFISRIGPFGGPKTSDEQKIDLILMEREDAEGSETSSNPISKRKVSSSRSKHDLIPLDELLSTPMDDNIRDDRPESPTVELQLSKEKLHAQDSHIRHLTSLLAETEQDLAKLSQLNEVLKEEVRRHERAVEREKHLQNSEYLKNVVFKFLTLTSGDERSRLVPVLNTILKLSPDETQTLHNVAKGADVIQRSWGSYLPIWSNHQ